MAKAKETLAMALVVTAEVMGTELSVRAAEAMARELAAYQPEAVREALQRCQRELAGRLTLAAILQRIDDGRPAVEEAWAICQGARDEADTVVWTDEISESFGVARLLLDEGDQVAARMAFREHYTEAVRKARAASRPTKWWPSLGHDASRRVGAVLDAVERKQLTADYARTLVGGDDLAERRLRQLGGGEEPPEGSGAPPAELAALVAKATPRRLS